MLTKIARFLVKEVQLWFVVLSFTALRCKCGDSTALYTHLLSQDPALVAVMPEGPG